MTAYLKRFVLSRFGLPFIIALPIFVTLFPLLVGGGVFANGDLLTGLYPTFTFYKNAVAGGQSFLWNPSLLSGYPSFASPVGLFLSPLNFLFFKFFSVMTAYHWLIFLHLAFAGWFTALLLKHFGLSFWPQVMGGLTYVYSQWFMIHDIGITAGLPVLPLLFLILWKLKEGKNWTILAGGLVIGYAWLAVHYNWLSMMLAASFLLSLYLAKEDSHASGLKRLRIPLKFFAMISIGTIIGLAQIIPTVLLSDFSGRGLGLSYAEASVHALDPFDFVRFFLPYFHPPFVAQGLSQLYVGIIPFFFLIIALTLKDKLVRFFGAVFFLSILISVIYSPLFFVLHKLPFFDTFRVPSRWMFIGMFAASVLVAFGVEQFQKERNAATSAPFARQQRLFTFFSRVSGAAAAVAVFLAFGLLFFRSRILDFLRQFFDKNFYGSAKKLPLEHYHSVIENLLNSVQEIFDFSNPKFIFSIVFLLVSVFVLRAAYREKTGEQNFSFARLGIIAVLNFVFIFFLWHPVLSQDVFNRQSHTATFLQEKNGRYVTFLPGFSEWIFLSAPHGAEENNSFIFQSELLPPNLNVFYGIPGIDGYENLMPRRNGRLLALLGSDRAVGGERLADLKISQEEKVKLFESRKYLLDMLAVQYVISAFPLNASLFNPVAETSVPPFGISLTVYRNPDARSLFYFADSLDIIPPSEDAAYEKLTEKPLTGRGVILECFSGCPDIEVGQSSLDVLSKENGKALLNVSVKKPALLVFSENHLPGWHAKIDGSSVPIYTANSVFMAVVIPPGAHRLEFEYSYRNLMYEFLDRF